MLFLKINVFLALEEILKVFIEIGKNPISNSHFVSNLKYSFESLDVSLPFETIDELLTFSMRTRLETIQMLNYLSDVWNEFIFFTKKNIHLLEKVHLKPKNKINYYFCLTLSLRLGGLVAQKLGRFIQKRR